MGWRGGPGILFGDRQIFIEKARNYVWVSIDRGGNPAASLLLFRAYPHPRNAVNENEKQSEQGKNVHCSRFCSHIQREKSHTPLSADCRMEYSSSDAVYSRTSH